MFECSDQELERRAKKRKRSDDSKIKNRIKTFRDKLKPILDHYSKKKKLQKVYAEESVENVWKEFNLLLKETIKSAKKK